MTSVSCVNVAGDPTTLSNAMDMTVEYAVNACLNLGSFSAAVARGSFVPSAWPMTCGRVPEHGAQASATIKCVANAMRREICVVSVQSAKRK